jgi:EmrB/QacA subfamily drug resistance transporter
MTTDQPSRVGDRNVASGDDALCPPARRWTVLRVALAAAFLMPLDFTIVNVALPVIGRDTDASEAALQWVVAGYALAYGLLLIPSGRLGDRAGHRLVLQVGLAGFVLTSAGCAVATDPAMLVAGRIAQGAMAGVVTPPVLAIIQAAFPPEERGRAFGWYGAVFGVTMAAGPLVGGVLVDADLAGTSWRPIFLVNVPIGILVMVLVARLVPETRGRGGGVDPVGVALVAGALALLIAPLVQGPRLGWPTWSVVCLALAPPAFAVFAWWELRCVRRDMTPVVDMRLFRIRSFTTGVGVMLVHFGTYIGLLFVLSLYVQSGLGRSALATGLVLSSFSVGTLVGAVVSDGLAARIGRAVLQWGSGLLAAGIVLTAALVGFGGGSPGWLLPGLLVAGVGNGLVLAPAMAIVLADVPQQDVGSASGVLNTAQRIGQTFGTALFGLLLFTSVHSARRRGETTLDAYDHALTLTLFAGVATAALTFLLVYALPKTVAGR